MRAPSCPPAVPDYFNSYTTPPHPTNHSHPPKPPNPHPPSVPDYFNSYTTTNGHGPVDTGSTSFNNVMNSLFETPAAVALMACLLLDLTIPSAPEERSQEAWQRQRCAGRALGARAGRHGQRRAGAARSRELWRSCSGACVPEGSASVSRHS